MTVHLTRARLDAVVVEQPVARMLLGDGLGLTEANGRVTLTLGDLQQPSAETGYAVKFPELRLTTALDEIYGGTAQTSYAVADFLVASSSHTLTKRSLGSTGTFLRASSSGDLIYSNLSLPSSGSSGHVLFISSSNAVTAAHVEDALRARHDAGSSTTGTWAPDANNGMMQVRATTMNLTVTLPTNLNSGQVLNFEIDSNGNNVTFASTDFRGPTLVFTAYEYVWGSIGHFGGSKYAVVASASTDSA